MSVRAMSDRSVWLLRRLITLAAVIVAVFVLRWMWSHYALAPWTRDGRVRADVVSVAPDVSGFVVKVTVHDNQVVRKGDPLFELDRARYEIAVQQAQATVARQRASLAEARREARRNDTLGEVVSSEVREQSRARMEEATAELQRGLVDGDSIHIDGYFEETQLSGIRIGDRVSVRLMGDSHLLYGHVQSLAPAIFDRERTPTGDLVADINPTFSWVRLAQRVPVRIQLDPGPVDVLLIAGRTATIVDLSYERGSRRSGRSAP
jgi:multidrug resistance efflux pump